MKNIKINTGKSAAASRNSAAIRKKVFVMMSGGVDSSVAALLLAKNKKYEVIGCFIKGYNIDGCQEADVEDARRTAEFLKIPFYVIDLEKEYKKSVVDYMIDGYRKGITPNPDVMCNKKIKFGLFLEKALKMGVDFVATGHYVRLASRYISDGTGRPLAPAASGGLDSRSDGSDFVGDQARRSSETFRTKHTEKLQKVYSLLEAKDKNKDQSYFLWTLTQKQLKHCLFPIGDYLKSEVREIARKAGLPTADKKDSQGICFLGMVKFKDFLKQYLPVKKGDVLDVDGKKIGEHDGVWFYTIGQRHINANFQFSISNFKKNRKPYYIAEKNIKTNTLVVAEGNDNPILYKKEIESTDVNFINPIIYNSKFMIPVYVRVRYRQPLVGAKLIIEKSKFKIIFNEPQKFVAPGQSAVFYSNERRNLPAGRQVLGGGIII
ncbi:tRNA-specific 2-thiouridylase [Candidatus Wolfebacteria bacterium]|nr:tRNA-specific 2-thiouridylase [Candidatus Wolfebacteria bacterium]